MPNTLSDHFRCTDRNRWSHVVELTATPYSTVISVVDIMGDTTTVVVMIVRVVVAVAAVQVAVVAVVRAAAKRI